ncbi:MAG TPA: phosphatidate cytidylyltransferase [Gaiellales bacterium]|nr:phosphatidate cytidylyltransferase [Gaiellales bacterium]
MSNLVSRIVFAVPLGLAAYFAVDEGGWLLVGIAVVAGLIALHEFYAMVRELRPLVPVGFVALVAAVVAVHHSGIVWAAAPLTGMLVVAFWMSAVAEVRQPATVQLAVTTFGVVWVGLGFAFLVAVRDLSGAHGFGRELLLAVLFGVWASDIAAFAVGSVVGRRQLAAEISPSKTVEGFIAGLVGGVAVVFVTLYHEPRGAPLSTVHALEFGAVIALAAPVGDLLESYLKRDLGVKDSGRLLGGHGGMLDRVDAFLLAGPAAYFLALAIGRA